MNPKSSVSNIFRSAVLPTLFGLLAGMVGGLAAWSQIAGGVIESPAPLSRRTSFSVTTPLPEADIADRLKRLDLPVYAKKPAAPGDIAERSLTSGDAIGLATVLTSDGWLLTHQSLLRSGGIQVAVDGRLFDTRQVVADARTGAVFIKIDAESLQVSGFEETDLMRPGAALYAKDGGRQFIKTLFSGTVPPDRKNRPEALMGSDDSFRIFRTQDAFSPKAAGGAVMTVGGNLAGVLVPAPSGSAAFIPMHLLRPLLSEVFRGQAIRRASLGVNYIDLESVTIAGESPSVARGALLAGSHKTGIPAVIPGGAADQAGLKEGDVLLRVADEELLGGGDLAEIISSYGPGDKVAIEALRDGKKQTFDVVLH